jgi:hypothetical protein
MAWPAPEANAASGLLSERFGVAAARGSGEAPRWRHHQERHPHASVTARRILLLLPTRAGGRAEAAGSPRRYAMDRLDVVVHGGWFCGPVPPCCVSTDVTATRFPGPFPLRPHSDPRLFSTCWRCTGSHRTSSGSAGLGPVPAVDMLRPCRHQRAGLRRFSLGTGARRSPISGLGSERFLLPMSLGMETQRWNCPRERARR